MAFSRQAGRIFSLGREYNRKDVLTTVGQTVKKIPLVVKNIIACLLIIVYNISDKNTLKLNSGTKALQSCDGCASKGTP